MCGGAVGKLFGSTMDAIGLTGFKKAEKGFDAQAAEAQAKKEAQLAENDAKAQRKKRKASDVLASAEENEKKTTLGG